MAAPRDVMDLLEEATFAELRRVQRRLDDVVDFKDWDEILVHMDMVLAVNYAIEHRFPEHLEYANRRNERGAAVAAV